MWKAVASTVAVASIAMGVNLAASKPAQAQDLALNLCTYVQGDDRMRMRQRIREERIRLRQVYEGVRCNDLSLIQFALANGSMDIGTFMVSQLPASTLSRTGDLAWAEANGHGDSEVAQAIRERTED
ncbi:DUF3718 domain-containing protein [Aliidiomarina maris]|uniref:Uncharacterized protein DUF3718 n=1 Tax=Aliidiomarina maris TaxID=531312 RepID=A0A327X685_9GAMM|nr:DUF3718 domain-containing protein [Aliidiomarina maris]MBA3988838.1 hypothetical protein [Idiomarina sp.]MCL5050201.1 DUF3718 domain-containing protein [Bacillota bacterium]RAK00623.1 uncharacterized protein DUF3718 [Aliidiomarina maris]RUO27366.1 hypothetical protein CWE07_05335 [Aliidiomarina maris]